MNNQAIVHSKSIAIKTEQIKKIIKVLNRSKISSKYNQLTYHISQNIFSTELTNKAGI